VVHFDVYNTVLSKHCMGAARWLWFGPKSGADHCSTVTFRFQNAGLHICCMKPVSVILYQYVLHCSIIHKLIPFMMFPIIY